MSRSEHIEVVGRSEEPQSLELVGEYGIRNVDEIAAALRERAGSAMRIDARGITSVDVCVLQLLVSASKSAAAAGHTLSIDAGAGGALELAIDRAGLAAAFRDSLSPARPYP